jgi:hypothetical protein
MTTQAGVETKERDFLAQGVGDAYQMLDLLPGVDPHGPALVWLACRSVPAAASRRLSACACVDTVLAAEPLTNAEIPADTRSCRVATAVTLSLPE